VEQSTASGRVFWRGLVLLPPGLWDGPVYFQHECDIRRRDTCDRPTGDLARDRFRGNRAFHPLSPAAAALARRERNALPTPTCKDHHSVWRPNSVDLLNQQALRRDLKHI